MILHQSWSLLLLSLAAAVLPGISRFVPLPAVVLEILFGVVLGKSLLNFQFSGDWVEFLAELGFLLLMFQAGMEIDFSTLKRQSKANLFVHGAVFVLVLTLSGMAAFFLNASIFVTLILSTTSLGLVVPTLKEMGIIRTPIGQSALIAATLADFLTLFCITFFLLAHKSGIGWEFLKPIFLFVGFGLLLKMGRSLAWWYPEKARILLAAKDTQEQGVRLSLALLFLLVALSELAHLEPVLGAFLGGAMLSLIFKDKDRLEKQLSGIGFGFLIPVFFINVGMNFDIQNVLSKESLLFTFVLFTVSIVVKIIPSLLLKFNGLSLRESINVGVLTSSRLSLIIVAASIGLEAGFISRSFKDSVVLLAVATCILGPTAFKKLYESGGSGKKKAKIDKKKMGAGWMQD